MVFVIVAIVVIKAIPGFFYSVMGVREWGICPRPTAVEGFESLRYQ